MQIVFWWAKVALVLEALCVGMDINGSGSPLGSRRLSKKKTTPFVGALKSSCIMTLVVKPK